MSAPIKKCSYYIGPNVPASISSLLSSHNRTRSNPFHADYLCFGYHSCGERALLLHSLNDATPNKSFILFSLSPKEKCISNAYLPGYEEDVLPSKCQGLPGWEHASVLRPRPVEGDKIDKWTFPFLNDSNQWRPKTWIKIGDLHQFPLSILKIVELDPEERKNWKLCLPTPHPFYPSDSTGPLEKYMRRKGLRLPKGIELLEFSDRDSIRIFLDGFPLSMIPKNYLLWFSKDRKIGTFFLSIPRHPVWVTPDEFEDLGGEEIFGEELSSHFLSNLPTSQLPSIQRKKFMLLKVDLKKEKSHWVVFPDCKLRQVPDSLGIERSIPWTHEIDLVLRDRADNLLQDVVTKYVERVEFNQHEKKSNEFYSESKWNEFFGSGFWTGTNAFDSSLGSWIEGFKSSRSSKEKNPEIKENRVSLDQDPTPHGWVLGLTDDNRIVNWINSGDGVLTDFLFTPFRPFTQAYSVEAAWKRLLSHEAWLRREVSTWSNLRHRCIKFSLDREEFLKDLDEVNDHLKLIEAEVESPMSFEVLLSEKVEQVSMKNSKALDLFGVQIEKIIDQKETLKREEETVFQQRGDLVIFWVRDLIDQLKQALSSFQTFDPNGYSIGEELDSDFLDDHEILLEIKNDPEGDEEDYLDPDSLFDEGEEEEIMSDVEDEEGEFSEQEELEDAFSV